MRISTRGLRLAGLIAAGAASIAFAGAAPTAGPEHADHAEQAAKGPIKVGQKVTNFTLKDTEGVDRQLQKYLDDGKIVVIEWFNSECPYIKKHHVHTTTMIDLEQEFRDQGVVWLAINSGAPGKQGTGLEHNIKARADYKMTYPLLLDESGEVGRMFGAKTTPDMRIITPDGVLAYAGAIDDNRMPRGEAKVNYVRQALREIIAGETVSVDQTRPYGCGIKYGARQRVRDRDRGVRGERPARQGGGG